MNDKGQQFYEYLKSINIEVPASYEEFQSAMQDQNTADQFYEFVKSQNVEVPETSAEFSSVFTSSGGADMGFTEGSQEPQAQPTEPSQENGAYNAPLTEQEQAIDKQVQEILASKPDFIKKKTEQEKIWDANPLEYFAPKKPTEEGTLKSMIEKSVGQIPEDQKMSQEELAKATQFFLDNRDARDAADMEQRIANLKPEEVSGLSKFDKEINAMIEKGFPLMANDEEFKNKLRVELIRDPERQARYRQGLWTLPGQPEKMMEDEEAFLITSQYLRDKNKQLLAQIQEQKPPQNLTEYIQAEKLKTDLVNNYEKYKELTTKNKALITKIKSDQEVVEDLNKGGTVNSNIDFVSRALNSLNNVATDLITLPATIAASMEDATGRGQLYTISDRILDYADKTYKNPLLVSERQFYNEQTGEFDLGAALLGAADQTGIIAALAIGNAYGAAEAAASVEGRLLTGFAKDALKAQSQNAYTIAGGYAASLEANRRDAKDMGLEGGDAFAYTQFMSFLEGTTGLIMPDNQIFSKEVKDIALKTFAANLSNGKRFAAQEALKSIGEIIGKENLEEILVLAGKTVQTGAIALNNEDVETVVPTLGEVINTVGTTTASMLIPSAISNAGKRKQIENQMIIKSLNDIEGSKAVVDQFVDKGVVKKEDADAFKRKLDLAYIASEEIPTNFNERQASEVLDPAIELVNLREQAKNKKGVAKELIDDDIRNLEEQIRLKAEEVKAQPPQEVTPTETVNVEQTTQEVNDYINNVVTATEEQVFGGRQIVDETLGKINNTEYISDTEIDNGIESVFNEIDRVNNLNISEQAKKNITDKLYNIAEQLDNYEFRTKAETRTTTKREAVTTPIKTPKTAVRVEEFFGGTPAEINGEIVKLSTADGRVVAPTSTGDVVIDTPTLDLKEDGVELDENGTFKSATFTDRLGNEIKFTGDTGLDLAIKARENKIGTVPEAMFIDLYNEVTSTEEVQVPYIKERKDAIQEQAAGQVPVQPEAGVSETMEGGKPQPKSEEAAKADQEKTEEVSPLDKLRERFGTPTAPKFQKGEEGAIDTSNIDEVQEEMDNLPEEVANFDAPSNLTTNEKANTKSLLQRFGEKFKNLWKGGVIKSISDFNGIPFIFTISDQLSSGTQSNPLTGNTIDLNGGLGFALTEGNENNAWANTAEDKAVEMLNNAQEVYRNNTELFDRLWKEGKLPYGHVPVAIVKMGQDSILTNEALFRLAADNIKTHFTEQERKNSLSGLKEDIKDFIYSSKSIITEENKKRRKKGLAPLTESEEKLFRDKTYSENKIIRFIEDNNFTTIDELLDNLNKLSTISDRRQVSDLLFTGGVGKDTDPTRGRPSKKSALALVGDKGKEYNKYIHTQTLNNILKEESTANIPEEHIIGITSIDVLNPQITTPNHRNYPYGVKGQMLGVLESPVHVADVFPEVYARVFAMNKPLETGELQSVKKVVGQAVAVGGAIAGIKALRGAKLNDKLSDLNKLLGKLKLAFPNIVVVDTKEEFENALNSPSVMKFVKDGEVVYGFTKDGKVYLNPDRVNLNTPIHEYSHVWMAFLEENNPALLEKGYSLLEGTELLDRKIKEFGDTRLAREEAMAEAIANKGETIIEAGKKSKFKNWLNAVFTYLKSKIKGFSKMSAEEIQNMTLEDFIDNSLAALLSGKEITTKEIKSLNLKFSKSRPSIQEVKDFAKENGIGKADVKEYLKELGYTADEIRKAYPREIKAPSAKRILGQPKPKKVTVQEMAALKSQIRLEARAARGAVKAIKEIRAQIQAALEGMVKGGKISSKQLNSILRKLNRINLLNPDMRERFINYMEKVYNNADYIEKISQANSARTRIKKLAKSKSVDAVVAESAKLFAKVDPQMVENIDEYNKIAEEVLSGLRKTTFNAANVADYANTQIEIQDKINLERVRKAFEEVTGIDAKDLTYDQMMALIDVEDNAKELETKAKEVRAAAEKYFNMYSTVVDEILKGTDPFTGEAVELDRYQSDLVRRLINLDLDTLSTKELATATRMLMGFVENGKVGGIEKLVQNKEGAQKAKVTKPRIIKALTVLGSKLAGRAEALRVTSLPILFEKKFGGFLEGQRIQRAMGFTDLTKAANTVKKIVDTTIIKYYDKFGKTRPNGDVFNSLENNIERGIYAAMKRTYNGSETEQKAEFSRKKGLIKDAIEELKQGDEKQMAAAEVYERLYNTIVKKAESIKDIESKIDPINKDAVDYWIDEFAKIKEDLDDVSLSMYNTVLENDLFYTPDVYKSVNKTEDIVEDKDSGFFNLSGKQVIAPGKAGQLKQINRPTKLKDRYISLDFDTNMVNAFNAGLMDIYTAPHISFIKGFMNSTEGKKLFGSKEDYRIFVERINNYIQAKRGQTRFNNKDIGKLMNFVAKIGAARALGSLTQPIKQVAPVAINTMINAGPQSFGEAVKLIYNNSAVNDFIDKSGYAIANRGASARMSIESLDKQLENKIKASKGKFDFVGALSESLIDKVLVKPDVAIARASWVAYYLQNLKKQGIEVDNINWETHKINDQAAEFAQGMVDRQQNISDEDLQGTLFTDTTTAKRFIRATLFPFSTFILNQKERMYSDIMALSPMSTATKEDRIIAARSLVGLIGEISSFTAIRAALGYLMYSASAALIGHYESDDDEERRIKNLIKGANTNFVSDLFSPLPAITDAAVMEVANLISNKLDGEDVVFTPRKKNFEDSFGTLGIVLSKARETGDLLDMAVDGKYTKEQFGKEIDIELTPEQQTQAQLAATLLILHDLGLPTEFGTVGRDIGKMVKIEAQGKEGDGNKYTRTKPIVQKSKTKTIKRKLTR